MRRSCKLLLLALLIPAITIAQDEGDSPDLTDETVSAAPQPGEVTEGDATPDASSDEAPEAASMAAEILELPAERAARLKSADGKVHVYRVPITDTISKPNLYILRRSVKQAMEADVKVLVIDMDTPGGRLDVTLEMMEILERFDGETITYVNKDAISAGAYISMATDSIYFAPDGVMGAAAVVSGGGEEINESMKAKINSYLLARMRSYTEAYPYRAEVIRAMADLDYELKIDGTVLKPEGELLSVTASEAVQTFGSPPRPLLADGIAEDLETLLAERYGPETAVLETFAISWSEEMAKYLDSIAAVLLGLGLLLLFVEFKTPGFGFFGIGGLVLIAVVFISNYLAGLAGYEALFIFLIGLALVIVDVLLLPGTFVFMIIGLLMMLGSIVWSLSDIWPAPTNDPAPGGLPFTVDTASLWGALYQLVGALAIAFLGLWLLWRFLPSTPIYGRLVHASTSGDPDPVISGGGSVAGTASLPDVGSRGIVVSPLHPLGEVLIDGQRFQATVAVGTLDKGASIVVTGYKQFSLLVESTRRASE